MYDFFVHASPNCTNAQLVEVSVAMDNFLILYILCGKFRNLKYIIIYIKTSWMINSQL